MTLKFKVHARAKYHQAESVADPGIKFGRGTFIHSYSFIENRNDRAHLHKYKQYKKSIKTVKTVNNSP